MIQVSRVSKQYGLVPALDAVTLAVASGQVTAVVGPHAAGKSTLLRAVASLVLPDAGEVTVDHVRHASAATPGRLLGAFLDPAWIPDRRTPRQHLTRACASLGLRRARVDELLAQTELAHVQGERVGALSAGQRQRLGVGAAIAGNPRNLLLDDPTRDMAAEDVDWLRRLLQEQVEAEHSVLVTAHRVADVPLAPHHVVELTAGRVVREGPVSMFPPSTDAPGRPERLEPWT